VNGVNILSKISIIIAEDHPLIRDGLAAILTMEENYDVVARTSNGLATLEQVKIHQPQLVIMDIHMPILNGLDATKQIKKEFPNTKILILTSFEDEQYMLDAITAGAAGFLMKGMHTDDMLVSIKECLAGRFSYPNSIQNHLIQSLQISASLTTEAAVSKLNPNGDAQNLDFWNEMTLQERKIALKLKQGKSNQIIANELFLTTGTVKNYLYSIYKKLAVNSRSEAIAFLYKYDI
jgi:two-component system response regulator DegU